MNFKKIKENDLLKIKGKKYEVINIEKEGDWLPKEDILRDVLWIYLVETNKDKITSTHRLFYYFDTKEIFLLNEKTKEKKEINLSQIDLISNR